MSETEQKGTILIVDDEPNILYFIVKVFQPRGYTILTAQNAFAGLKYFEACDGTIDLVIADVMMPEMDGITMIKKIREYQPDIPVIVMSAADDLQQECEKLGVVRYIQKPYSLEDLYELVESQLNGSEDRAEKYELAADVQPDAKVLIVDDEIEVAQIIGEALFEDFPESNFRVRAAKSGAEAIEISKQFQPDIAIVDMKMPQMSGDELIVRMKNGEGHCPRDFVIYTGVTDRETIQKAENLGHRVLKKPTNIEELHAVLIRICVRHHLLKKKEF